MMMVRATATMSLSATGSRKVPSGVTAFQRRARYPSKKSVTEAAANMREEVKQGLGKMGKSAVAARRGMETTRAPVKMMGTVALLNRTVARKWEAWGLIRGELFGRRQDDGKEGGTDSAKAIGWRVR